MPWYGLLGVVFCLMTGGCAAKSSGLVGKWVFADKSQGPLVLSFTQDGGFIVDAEADGKKDIWGRYELFGQRVEFVDAQPWIGSDCHESGFHDFTIEEGTLRFSESADSCLPRKSVLRQPMVRAGTPDRTSPPPQEIF